MTTISRSALVMHLPNQMYDLVNDVAAYPRFLPWCNGVEVIEKTEDTQTATIFIARAAIRQRLTTYNTMLPGQRIDMSLVDGPFSYLRGSWVFTPLGDAGCKVVLNVEFSLSNRMPAGSIGSIFNSICGSLIEAFCQRADQVYQKHL